MKDWKNFKEEHQVNEKVGLMAKDVRKRIDGAFKGINKPELIQDMSDAVIKVLKDYGYDVQET